MAPPRRAFSPTGPTTVYPVRRLADGVYAILGDSGQGVEGRPNAGFIADRSGIVVVGGVASPVQGDAVVRTVRSISSAPIRWLVLYAHHPDMQFGAVALRRAGAKVVAHPDTHVLAAEGGPDPMVEAWSKVVGLQEMIGFEFANTPDRPVTGTDTLRLGKREIVVLHPGDAHSAGDLMVWLPAERVLFTGDILVEDGITMVVDGSAAALLKALDLIDQLRPRVVVPGHGRIPEDPARLIAATRSYLLELTARMRSAVERGESMRHALEDLPPADGDRPVSVNSRRRRNAARVYVEMQNAMMGIE